MSSVVKIEEMVPFTGKDCRAEAMVLQRAGRRFELRGDGGTWGRWRGTVPGEAHHVCGWAFGIGTYRLLPPEIVLLVPFGGPTYIEEALGLQLQGRVFQRLSAGSDRWELPLADSGLSFRDERTMYRLLPEGWRPPAPEKSELTAAVIAAFQELQSRMATAPDTVTDEEWELVNEMCLFHAGWKAGRKSVAGS